MSDLWTTDAFTNEVTSALVAAYETEIDRRVPPESRLRDEDLMRMRKQGIFIPANDRVYMKGLYVFGAEREPPAKACISLGAERSDRLQAYITIYFSVRIERLPPEIQRISSGLTYESLGIFPQDRGGIAGTREYFVVTPQGLPRLQPRRRLPQWAKKYRPSCEQAFVASLQLQQDMVNQWTITAQDKATKVTVGAYPESVKSVLYARTLPLTASGRKRPILHLVEAHKRRMKSGIDIDISDFLRGTREVEMDGIRYSVAPSKALQAQLDAEKADRQAS